MTPQQIHVLTELIERQLVFFAGKTLGPDVLSDADKRLLTLQGIDPEQIYSAEHDLVTNNFILGMLASALGDQRTKKLTYEELLKYIASGQHIPLNQRELATINSVKVQSLADIRATAGRIFTDVNRVVGQQLSTARANQEEFIRKQVTEGLEQRKSFQQIARDLAKLTGDWTRNFKKSVQYISHTALNEGRAALIERRYGNNTEAKLFFQVQPDACDTCVKSYMTTGPGSQPRIFTLKQLQQNGTNIGRKTADWKATLGALHVNCRCLATEYLEGQVWNGHRFVWPVEAEKPKTRPLVRLTFNGQEHFV